MRVHRRFPSPSVARGIAVMLLLTSVPRAHPVSAADALGKVGAGIVSQLVLDPFAPRTLYALTECGGVLKSTDGGNTWHTANTGLDSGAGPAFAIDPTTPNTLYTGNGGSYGVSRSTDGGHTWQSLAHRPSYFAAAAQVLVIDPTRPAPSTRHPQMVPAC